MNISMNNNTSAPSSIDYKLLKTIASEYPYPLLFATISGAHLYGFPSPDSDFDLRGAHLLGFKDLLGLNKGDDNVEVSGDKHGIDLDLVTHDAEKFFTLMLKRNGYVLEQLFSPLVVTTSDAHKDLIELGKKCITIHHSHHYLGFSRNQWQLDARCSSM
jgi:uncharacterized protein